MDINKIGMNTWSIPGEDTKLNPKLNNNNLFGNYLNSALDKVNQLQIESDDYKTLLATGDVDNLHDVTLAQEKANISLQLTLSIRNKVVEAYREIMRMQI